VKIDRLFIFSSKCLQIPKQNYQLQMSTNTEAKLSTMHWWKIGVLTPILLIAALIINEMLLYVAKHEPSVVSDADLFCDLYTGIRDLGGEDVVFLGASRMQTGLDLATFYQRYPTKKALLLAQSGRGSSYPVFKDIVNRTNYRGIAIIDETEGNLTAQNKDQQPFIDHCHANFSINRQLNRRISTWLQSHLLFLNPESSSLRLWGNLVIQHQLPDPFYTKTRGDRQQLTDYARANHQKLKSLRASRLGFKNSATSLPTFEQWSSETKHWQPLIDKFQQRGGKIIFVRMPVDRDRWNFESKIYPPDRYWQPWMDQMNVKSIHFADSPDLSSFRLPDTSHLDMRDKAAFTKIWLTHLQAQLPGLSAAKPK